jgi:hypothetical protein
VSSCDLCAATLGEAHSHLVYVAEGRLLCACAPCALLLGYGAGERYRVVPDRVRHLPDIHLTDPHWEALGVPVDLAFFYWSTPAGRQVAFYPSPAGATECLLPLDAWAGLAAANPALATLEPDVEALLVNRTRGRREAYLVPIDACYHLVGMVRLRWRGFSGGDVWEAVDRFFLELRSRSEVAA